MTPAEISRETDAEIENIDKKVRHMANEFRRKAHKECEEKHNQKQKKGLYGRTGLYYVLRFLKGQNLKVS